MHGPLINDWVDQQEKKLADRIDTSNRNWVCEDNEILWSEFEMAFLAAWTDTSKKQNVYDQLMCLTMNGWVLRYCRNVRPTWVKFNSKDTKESEWRSRF